ncbi:hypothetical protein [Desulfovibrio psychrotolerans]|uniref:Uncharacterized protein n=1 Tax=Desulfovibrio psychrotolerans TaxID=415242 RepID=A0A7J0BWF2_9BACT|nr:hypothetical protein [Desulfovibrio psychrotolerans]GFM38028.1 hypothetical protein DSM19430T_27120 [Desulfovibrio psychrotolerans]
MEVACPLAQSASNCLLRLPLSGQPFSFLTLLCGQAAAALGGDPNAAAALVALEIADKAITACDAWELAQAISEGDGEKVEAKALEIGVSLATDAIPGNVVMIKLGKALHVLGLGTVGTKIVAKVGGKVDDVLVSLVGHDGVGLLLAVEEKYGNRLWTTGKPGSSSVNAAEHWNKHGGEFADINSVDQYVERAHSMFTGTQGSTLTVVRTNGEVVKYHPQSNTIAVFSEDGIPKTMFKPDASVHGMSSNLEYFYSQGR